MGGVVGEDGGDLGVFFAGRSGVRRRRCGGREALAGGGREGKFGGCGGGGGGRAGGVRAGHWADLLDGLWRGWRASTRAALVVDDLVEAAVLEEDVLAGNEAVGGAGEGVGEREDGRGGAAVLDAGVAVGRDAQAEVEVAGVLEGEADVRGEDNVLRFA